MPAPLKIAYVEIETTGGLFGTDRTARGHLFHHSEIADRTTERCYRMRTSRGEQSEEGYSLANVLASYVHLELASAPALPTALVERCRSFRAARGGDF